MGIIVQGKGLWRALFTRTQRRVLSLLFGHPDKSYFANEIVRLAAVGTGSVQRELARLADSGLLSVSRIGNQKHYQANPDSPIFPELRSIVLKTFGALDQLRTALDQLGGEIETAFIFGPDVHATAPSGSHLDMLIVAVELRYGDVVNGLTDTENRIGRSIQPLLFTPSDYQKLLTEENEGLLQILAQPRVMLVNPHIT